MMFDLDPIYLFYGFAALAAILATEAAYLLFHNTTDYRRRVNRRLQISAGNPDREKVLVQLRRERGLSADGVSILSVAWFNRLVTQSGVKVSLWRAVALIAGLGFAAFAGTFLWRHDLTLSGIVALAAMIALPLFGLTFLRKRRHAAFAARLPDAMDVIVRSLRARHPVPVAISMVARELPDPIGSEFGMVADEITYGADIETALRNMMQRVGQEDLPLFVTSVAIQSTTGGNLSQILDNLSKVIRERFKIKRQLRVVSAHGRLTGTVLALMPPSLGVFLLIRMPEHFEILTTDPAGIRMIMVAVFLQILGGFLIYKITKVEY